MSRRGRNPLPFFAAAAAVVLLGGAVAFAVTRPPVPAHRAASALSAASAVQEAATSAVKRAKVTLTPAKPVAVKPAAIASAPPAAKAAPHPRPSQPPLTFDSKRAMAHVRTLADGIGMRVGGSGGEWRAFVYVRDYLTSLGYQVTVTPVRLDNGKTSHNVIAKRAGATGPIVVLGAHIDSKYPAPGADDNATGVGAMLELARDFAASPTRADVRFVAFGCEELIGDGDSDHHHYGSRAYVRSLSAEERARFAAMVSIDMIGYGSDFRVRTMGVGPMLLVEQLLSSAHPLRASLGYLKDPGASGWSDHEPFERAGFPSAWLEWRDDPNAHTARDTASRVDESKVRVTGQLVRIWLLSLDADTLRRLVHE